MGVLDDAIRAHLDLKREHGASEDEVAKQEQEALGATRAEPVSAEPPSEEALAEDAAPVGDTGLSAELIQAEEEAPAAEPEPAAAAEPQADSPTGDTPTRGFDALDPETDPEADAPPAADGEEDVLEETPEFLQETPEHDRLWFEQKPPRDFDFDEE
jgi:hypothetical protein